MRVSRRSFVFLGAAGLATAQEAPTAADRAAMDAVVTEFMETHAVPGMSVAVARNGTLAYEKGYGFADRERAEKVSSTHLFRIASVSKPITSVAVFQLVEQGKLRLDDTIFGPGGILGSDFGPPPYPPHVAEIRLRHLLTHTAGGWQNDGSDPMFRNLRMNQRELITWAIGNVPLTNPPGEKYAYSNFGYCVVGRVIEKVTGKPYDQHVRESILKQCGIADMRIAGNSLAERAAGEVVYYGAGQNPYDMNVHRMDSHGGWLASPASLVLFATHLNLLRPESVTQMTTGTAANPGYACGWAVNKVPNWWHTGSLPGTTSILVHTASGYCWAALLNTRESKVDTGGALDAMMWRMVRQVKSWKA